MQSEGLNGMQGRGGQGPDSPVLQALLRALELYPKDSGKVKKLKPGNEIILTLAAMWKMKRIKNGYGSTQRKGKQNFKKISALHVPCSSVHSSQDMEATYVPISR